MTLRFATIVIASAITSGCLLLETFPDVATPRDAGAVDAAPFDPSALVGLALWLDASQGVVTTVTGISSWEDRTGGSPASQLDRNLQPSLRADAINGRAAVHFNGADEFLLVPDSRPLQFGVGDFTVMAVAAWSNVPRPNDHNRGYAALFVKTSPYPPYEGPGLFGNDIALQTGSARAQVDSNTWVDTETATLNDGRFHVVSMRRTSGVVSVRADGQTSGSAVVGAFDVSALGMGAYIGGRDPTGAFQSLRGDIAELIAVKGPVSDDALGKLETYLRAKYGL